MKRQLLLIRLTLLTTAAASAEKQVGKIVIYREPDSSPYIPAVFCDDAKLGTMVAGSYLDVKALAGAHACVAGSQQQPRRRST